MPTLENVCQYNSTVVSERYSCILDAILKEIYVTSGNRWLSYGQSLNPFLKWGLSIRIANVYSLWNGRDVLKGNGYNCKGENLSKCLSPLSIGVYSKGIEFATAKKILSFHSITSFRKGLGLVVYLCKKSRKIYQVYPRPLKEHVIYSGYENEAAIQCADPLLLSATYTYTDATGTYCSDLNTTIIDSCNNNLTVIQFNDTLVNNNDCVAKVEKWSSKFYEYFTVFRF